MFGTKNWQFCSGQNSLQGKQTEHRLASHPLEDSRYADYIQNVCCCLSAIYFVLARRMKGILQISSPVFFFFHPSSLKLLCRLMLLLLLLLFHNFSCSLDLVFHDLFPFHSHQLVQFEGGQRIFVRTVRCAGLLNGVVQFL